MIDSASKKATRLRRTALAAIFFFALLFRLLPLEYGRPAPAYFSADEIDSVSRAVKMAQGDLMPIHANKPTLYPGALAVVYGIEFLAGKVFAGWTVDDFAGRFFREPFSFYRGARLVSIAGSVGALLLVGWGLRRAGFAAQAIALAILAFGRSSVFYGHVAKADSVAAFFTTAALVFSFEALHRRSAGEKRARAFLLLAAAAAGFAISTKYNCFFAPLFPLIAWWQMGRNWRLLAAVAVAGPAAFFLATPYALLHPVAFVERTLASPIASQVAGALNHVSYMDRHGPLFLAKMFWRELGSMIVPVAAAVVLAGRERRIQRVLLLGPACLYFGVLVLSSQLDFQYLLPLMPVLAVVTGMVLGDGAGRLKRVMLMFLALGMASNGFYILRDTVSYLGGDTRLVAAEFIRTELPVPEKPLLVVSPYYFQYFPPLEWNAATFERLLGEAQASGGEGGYLREMLGHVTGTEAYEARFLDVKVGYANLPDGGREFQKQPFSLDWEDYAGEYSMVVVPGNAFILMGHAEPELQSYQDFLRRIQELPLVAEFHAESWKLSGPSLWIYRAE